MGGCPVGRSTSGSHQAQGVYRDRRSYAGYICPCIHAGVPATCTVAHSECVRVCSSPCGRGPLSTICRQFSQQFYTGSPTLVLNTHTQNVVISTTLSDDRFCETRASGENTLFICQFFSFIGVFSPGLVGEGVVVRSAVVVSGSCACVDK